MQDNLGCGGANKQMKVVCCPYVYVVPCVRTPNPESGFPPLEVLTTEFLVRSYASACVLPQHQQQPQAEEHKSLSGPAAGIRDVVTSTTRCDVVVHCIQVIPMLHSVQTFAGIFSEEPSGCML